MLGRLRTLNAFSTYDIFNLQWVIRMYPRCKSRRMCIWNVPGHQNAMAQPSPADDPSELSQIERRGLGHFIPASAPPGWGYSLG